MDTNLDLLNGALLGSGSSQARRLKGKAKCKADVSTVKATLRVPQTQRRLTGVVFCEANTKHKWTSRFVASVSCRASVSHEYGRLSTTLASRVNAFARHVSRIRARVSMRASLAPTATVTSNFGSRQSRLESSLVQQCFYYAKLRKG